MLYIVLFLHQTTTVRCRSSHLYSCISYYSYIKPQPDLHCKDGWCVVYRTIPTSNHNWTTTYQNFLDVVYRTIPTSNHNFFTLTYDNDQLYIVLFLHQTTTTSPELQNSLRLYIVLFLHQTTTNHHREHQHQKLYIVLFLHQTTTYQTIIN